MKRKPIILLVLILCTFPLTGCWSSTQLNELGVITAIGVDLSDQQFLVTVQMINPGEIAARKGGGEMRAPVTIYQQKGPSLFEAIRKLTIDTPRRSYFAHLQMLIIGEELARKKGISEILDLFSRHREIRTDFYIAVSRGVKAEDILKILTPIEKIPGNRMLISIEMSQKLWADTIGVHLDELINKLINEGKNPALTGIRIKGNLRKSQDRGNVERIAPYGLMSFSGVAVFRKDKLIGWLEEEEGRAFNLVQGKVQSTVDHVMCPKSGDMSIELTRTKRKIKGIVENGKPRVEVRINAEGNIGEVACPLDLTKPETIYDLERITNQTIEREITRVLKKVQKNFKSDIFGFGDAIYREHPKAWKQLKNNWDEEFAQLPVRITVDVKLRRTGTINNSFIER